MTAKSGLTKDYENETALGLWENKANSKPIKANVENPGRRVRRLEVREDF